MKKKRFVYALSAMLLLGAPLVACGPKNDPVTPPGPGPVDPVNGDVHSFDAALSGSSSIVVGETVNIVISNVIDKDGNEISDAEFDYTSSDEDIASVNSNGTIRAVKAGEATITVECLDGDKDLETKTFTITVSEVELADGAFNYVAKTYEERLDILGKLEKYAVDQHLTGITLFQNGGYIMYSDRIQKPTNNYITGYGFGVLSEGTITKPMSAKAEPEEKWQMYYHSFGGTTNKGKFNYLDDTGSESADLYGYVTSTYYSTKMNSSKDGYDYYPVLALPTPGKTGQDAVRPLALNKNEATNLATKYRVYVRTTKNTPDLKYHTLSSKYSKFDGAAVELEDYTVPYRLLLNQSIGLARSADFISDSNNGTLKGAKAYYSATANNSNIEESWDTFNKLVGLKTGEDKDGEYIDFEFNTPVSEFTAMTNLSSSLTSPIKKEFLKEIAPDKSASNVYKSAMKDAYGTVTKGNESITPVDNLLALAPYVLEATSQTYNVFKRNENWFEFKLSDPSISGRYKIEGIKITYLQAAASDKNAAFNTFINQDALDAVSIPKDFMAQYINDPRTTKTEGDSTFKLNLNTCTQKEWNDRFNNPEDNKSTYNGGISYSCKALMSNDSFINALSFALDREEFATTRGNVPSQSYFAPAYLWEPESGKSYDSTAQHAAAIAEYSPSTYGYNEELAIKLFDKAISEEISRGKYTWTSKETINIHWMNTTDTDEYGKDIVGYFDKAFSKTDAYKKGFRITFNNINGSTNYQEVYNTMKKGTYDIGFGAVSGMQLDPLGFLEVLKSNNSSGFTLNFGPDTSVIGEEKSGNYVYYDGKKWSFDGLWTAANKGAIVNASQNGKIIETPIEISQAGTSVADGFIQETPVKQLAIQIGQAEGAEVAKFKLFADVRKKEDEYISISLSYKDGEMTKVAVYNLYFDDLYFTVEGINEDGSFDFEDDEPRIIISLPTVFNSSTTNGQITEEFTYDKVQSIGAYVTYYMVIGETPTSTTLDVSFKIK